MLKDISCTLSSVPESLAYADIYLGKFCPAVVHLPGGHLIFPDLFGPSIVAFLAVNLTAKLDWLLWTWTMFIDI